MTENRNGLWMAVGLAAAGGVAAWLMSRSRYKELAPQTRLNRYVDERDADAAYGTRRPAGPQEMRDPPKREWDIVDEGSDESFPASDPPSHMASTGVPGDTPPPPKPDSDRG